MIKKRLVREKGERIQNGDMTRKGRRITLEKKGQLTIVREVIKRGVRGTVQEKKEM